jgi:hypothetical protein
MQQRISIAEDGFESHNNVVSLAEKDIGDQAKGFANNKTTADGRIKFELKRSTYSRPPLIGLRISDASAGQPHLRASMTLPNSKQELK